MSRKFLSIVWSIAWPIIALCASCLSVPAWAQLRLPGLPGDGRLPGDELLRRAEAPLNSASPLLVPLDPQRWRERLSDRLLKRYPDQLQRNTAGELVFTGELLALPSSGAARQRVLARSALTLVEETRLDGLDLVWLRLRLPAGTGPSSLDALIAQLRTDDPDGTYDYHHVYVDAGAVAVASGTGPGSSAAAPSAREPSAPTQAPAPTPTPMRTPTAERRIGMIDSGIDAAHPALRQTALTREGCAGQARPAAHGTAVASLLVGDSDAGFHGAMPRGRLFAVDVYCEGGPRAGGGVQAIAEGFAWLARQRVGVVNISLVGPPNALLRRVVEAAQAQGLLIVAPVGNDGPNAPPLYPAAWPGVIAVTGVDARRRVLVEAGRGPHVVFAAPGGDMVAAQAGARSYAAVRGTSFAAPLVAGLLGTLLPSADRGAASKVVDMLAHEAVDLGAPGRDEVYGMGLVGASLRVGADDLR